VAANGTRKKKKAGESAVSAKSAAPKTHTVKPGETLYSIASQYNTTVAALQRDNSGVAGKLRVGDVLVIRQ